ncbi:Uncharacterised protein [Salmonella enterica subsp. salamae]|nr:Uncharacterised protein [Salmonella enterica subsp. salamae]
MWSLKMRTTTWSGDRPYSWPRKPGAADKVTFVAPGSGRDAATFTTGNTGEAMQTLTAAVPGDKVVNATVNGNTGNVTVNFQQDKSLKVTGVTVNGGAGGSYCGSDTCEVGVTDKSKVSLSATVGQRQRTTGRQYSGELDAGQRQHLPGRHG